MRLAHTVLLLCFLAIPLTAQEQVATTLNEQALSFKDTSEVDIQRFAATIAGNAQTGYERAERLLTWLSRHFKWLSTDYLKRTVKEIIVRKGGNCFELATVYMSLIKVLGIRYRPIAEINIHPVSERRRTSAEELVARRGFSASVFGKQHNDHRWVEIYDEKNNEWVPADPSVGVIGLEAWLKSRVWFGERWAIDTSITNDMIVPFAIFVTGNKNEILEDRTQYYLVESFNRLYKEGLKELSSWSQ